eukprot:jgi/Bigna1/68447/fgenesh1_pg.6_\
MFASDSSADDDDYSYTQLPRRVTLTLGIFFILLITLRPMEEPGSHLALVTTAFRDPDAAPSNAVSNQIIQTLTERSQETAPRPEILARQARHLSSHASYARIVRNQEKVRRIEQRPVTLETEVIAELQQASELAEVYKDALVFQIRKSKLRVEMLTKDIVEDLLQDVLRPKVVSKHLVTAMWQHVVNATKTFHLFHDTGRPHPRLVRESQRGMLDEERRAPPPVTDVFAARLLVQRMLNDFHPGRGKEGEEGESSRTTGVLKENLHSKPHSQFMAMAQRATQSDEQTRAQEGADGKTAFVAAPPTYRKAKFVIVKAGSLASEVGIGTKSCYLMGRGGLDEGVDIAALHPSISRLHVKLEHDAEGDVFVTDLGSQHGTFVNGEKIEPSTHRILLEGDFLKLGSSTRSYMMSYNPEPGKQADHFAANLGAKLRKSVPVSSKL